MRFCGPVPHAATSFRAVRLPQPELRLNKAAMLRRMKSENCELTNVNTSRSANEHLRLANPLCAAAAALIATGKQP